MHAPPLMVDSNNTAMPNNFFSIRIKTTLSGSMRGSIPSIFTTLKHPRSSLRCTNENVLGGEYILSVSHTIEFAPLQPTMSSYGPF